MKIAKDGIVKPKGKSRRTRKVDTRTLKSRLRTVLTREIEHLMDESYTKKLDAKNVTAIATYVRLVNELEQLEKIDEEHKKAMDPKT